jgi:small-conductance mechanosensitive channel
MFDTQLKPFFKPKLFLAALLIAMATGAQADQLTELITGTKAEAPVVSDKVITTDNSKQDDRKIKQRLREIFTELEALRNIGIAVNKGVVTLSGEIDASSSGDKAMQFARLVEGVVEVENELQINRSLGKRLTNTWDKLWVMSKETLANLPLLMISLLIFSVFWWLGSWISKRKIFRRFSPNHFIADLLGQITHLLFVVFGIVLALILLDATALIGTILGAAGIVGLAVGFAVRDTVENYISSILLSLRNPFQANDYVSIDGNNGNVLRLTSRATILLSPEGNHIRIPNSKVFKAVITNYTRHSERRFQFDVGVDTEQDLLVAQTLATSILKNTEGVLEEPKPLVVIQELGDSNVLLRIYAWVNQENYSYAKVRSETIRAVKEAFDDAEIVMPEPIYNLRLMQNGAAKNLAENSATENTKSATPIKTAVSPQNNTAITDDADVLEVTDVTPDRTVENKVLAEQASSDNEGENLLTDDAPKE